MTKEDFLRAVLEGEKLSDSPVDKEKYEALFTLADYNLDGKLAFDEYFLFEVLMTGPDADYYIAFTLVDRDNDGRISMADFTRLLQMGALVSKYPFNLESDWATSFFGRTADATLDFAEFTQLLKGFEGEKLSQAFSHVASSQNGKISAAQFDHILTHTMSHRSISELPPLVRANIKKVLGDEISFAQLSAWTNVIHGLDRVREAIILASDEKRHPQVTEKEFLRTARRLPLADFTPMESAIVFKIFDADNDGTISLADFETVVPVKISKSEKAAGKVEAQANQTKSKSAANHAVDVRSLV